MDLPGRVRCRATRTDGNPHTDGNPRSDDPIPEPDADSYLHSCNLERRDDLRRREHGNAQRHPLSGELVDAR